MSSVRGPQKGDSRAKTPQIACAWLALPGGHASRFSAGGCDSSPRSSRSTSCSRSRGTRARMNAVSSPVGSRRSRPSRPDRFEGHVQQERALAAAVGREHGVLQQRPRFNADLAVEPRVVAATQQQPPRGSLRDRCDPARRRLGERQGREPLSSGTAINAAASALLNNNRGLTGGRQRSSRRAQKGSQRRRSPPSSWYWPNAASSPPSRPRARRRPVAHAPARIVAANNGVPAFASIALAHSSENGSATCAGAGLPIGCGDPGVKASTTPPSSTQPIIPQHKLG